MTYLHPKSPSIGWGGAVAAGLVSFLGGCSVSMTGSLPTTPVAQSVQATPTVKTLRQPLALPAEYDRHGGLIAADVNGDRQMEIIVTQPGWLAAYSPTGGQLWERRTDIHLTGQAESEGLPGLHGPGVQVGDIDQDGALEVLYVVEGNALEVLAAATGNLKHRITLPEVSALNDQWEHAIIGNFRGKGDLDLLLQASRKTNADDYFRDSLQTAFALEELLTYGPEAQPLWSNSGFVSVSHGSAKVIDLDRDGKDEVVGATILSAAGQELYNPGVANTNFPHMDSFAVDDIAPDQPGLEVVMPEERGEVRVILFNQEKTLWTSTHRRKAEDFDGDKVVVGNFDPNSPGLEMWFRGNESKHFTVMNAAGDVVASYKFSDRRPPSWTEAGLEVITRIRWTGADQDYIVAKERH
ncbi:MAG TPA: FG-GAP-like repeat-containing protein, partial [Candidatus Obscuribacterales bacterium]